MEMSWLRVLLDKISSYLSISSMDNLYSNPAHRYYTRGEEIAKLLKPVLENLIGSDAAPSKLLNNGFEELSQYADELRDQFENWQPLSSRIFYVLRIELLSSKLRESSLEVFQLLKHCEQHLPADLVSPSFEDCVELVKLVGRKEISYTIDLALIDQRKGVGPASEVLMKIAESVGLRSNQDILIEGVVLANMKENAEDNTEAEFIEGLISLTTKMHGYFTNIKESRLGCPVSVPSDFRCPLSLELMTDPVIVATGQTYERVFIEKWFDMGLMVCPKTRQALSNTTLTTNFVVKAFIANWCESNNVNPPDPLELIHSSQPFRLLVESGSCDDSDESQPLSLVDDTLKGDESVPFNELKSERGSSSPMKFAGNGHTESLDDTKCEELHQVLSRSASAPGLVSEAVSKTERSTNADVAGAAAGAAANVETVWRLPSARQFRNPGIIPATVREAGSSSSVEDEVKKLIEDLNSSSLDTLREATARIRILSRNSTDNRIIIAQCGGINSLVSLLYSTDERILADDRIQADAVTCLLNLSINTNNKSIIADSGAIERLIHILKTGNQEAKENSAATLFSLSVIEENKTKIGEAGGIEPLVELLGNGSLRGKKDAISALFNLSLHHENKAKVIEAGAVRYFVELMDPAAGMVEKAVAVLANLSSTKEGRVALGEEGIPVLVEVVELGSARGKENAAAALLQMSMHSSRFCNIVIREGAIPPLVALTKSGTARAKEKAHNLLKYFKSQKQGNERRG